ncbi:MAG: DUF192 domain-containing protein [Elusimicrobiales bacterium]|nr:DUF192 domain-containing protein [Elusimicrobiales bacterium]
MRFLRTSLVFALALFAAGNCFAGVKAKTVKITLPDKTAVTAELALTDEEHERGLMFRRSLGEKRGMLFVFDAEALRTFWMKNTLMDLAIAFAGADKKITVCYDKVPKSRADTADADVARVIGYAKYVVELPPGSCGRHGLAVGAPLGFVLPEKKAK